MTMDRLAGSPSVKRRKAQLIHHIFQRCLEVPLLRPELHADLRRDVSLVRAASSSWNACINFAQHVILSESLQQGIPSPADRRQHPYACKARTMEPRNVLLPVQADIQKMRRLMQ